MKIEIAHHWSIFEEWVSFGKHNHGLILPQSMIQQTINKSLHRSHINLSSSTGETNKNKIFDMYKASNSSVVWYYVFIMAWMKTLFPINLGWTLYTESYECSK